MSERWTLGVLIGLPATVVAVTALVLAGFALMRTATDPETFEPEIFGWCGAACWIAAFLVAALVAVGFYPYSTDYHKWKPVTGTVASNTDVAIDSSWVITFEGDSTKYDCLETRCADMGPGDEVTLFCIHRFVWGGTDWIECKYGEG